MHQRGAADMNLPGSILEIFGEIGDPLKKSNTKELTTLDNNGNFFMDTYERPDSEFGQRYGQSGIDTLNENAPTFEVAEAIVRGQSRSRDVFKLTVNTIGLAGPTPGGLVQIGDFSSKFDGLWYVHSICQTITHDRMLTEAQLVSDALKDGSKTVYPVSPYVEPPVPVLLNSVWQATYPMEDMYEL